MTKAAINPVLQGKFINFTAHPLTTCLCVTYALIAALCIYPK